METIPLSQDSSSTDWQDWSSFAKQWLQTKNSWYLCLKQKLQYTLAIALLSKSPSGPAWGRRCFRPWAERCQNVESWSQSGSAGAGALPPHTLPETATGAPCSASNLLPWADAAWQRLSAASLLHSPALAAGHQPLATAPATTPSPGGAVSGRCCEGLWQGGCRVHLPCLWLAAPLTALVTSCRVFHSEALQTLLSFPGSIAWHGHVGFSISAEWQLLSAGKQRRWGWD